MNLYKYVASEAVKNYWKEKNFIPTPLEAAFLISRSANPNITLNEKWADYLQLSQSQDLCYIPSQQWYTYNITLCEFLSLVIQTEKKLLCRFMDYSRQEKKYYARIQYNSFEPIRNINGLYTFPEIKSILNNVKFYSLYLIRDYDNGERIGISFNNDFSPIYFILGSGSIEDDNIIHNVLTQFYFDFPIPFEIGSRVYSRALHLGPKNPLFIKKLPKHSSKTDVHDIPLYNLMDMNILGIDDNGCEVKTIAIDLEYSIDEIAELIKRDLNIDRNQSIWRISCKYHIPYTLATKIVTDVFSIDIVH